MRHSGLDERMAKEIQAFLLTLQQDYGAGLDRLAQQAESLGSMMQEICA